ncbi:hypothetical protein ACIA8H_33650 [Streptomyces goshikiensis]|uniref:hypothetical protein n=1 Tax=Streptomyces goshikiensis TaxID=1942 RepID=UPI0037B7FA9A
MSRKPRKPRTFRKSRSADREHVLALTLLGRIAAGAVSGAVRSLTAWLLER